MFGNQNNVHYNKSMRLYDRNGISSPLSYDSKLVEYRVRLRREIEQIKRKMSLYNDCISTDNFL